MRARIWDIWRRAETGPICPVKRFDTRVYWPRLKEVVKEYGIQYDPEIIVPTDNTLIDDVYRAAVKLLLDVGVLCLDTERIIQLEEGEVKEMLRNKPRQVTLGEGKDAVTIVHRDLEDRRPPRILGRILGKITEEVALKVYQSFAQEPIIEIINPQPTFTLLEGLPIKAGSPFEMHAEICNLAYVRAALRRAGRPGMPLFGSPSATDTPNIGGSSPEYGWRRTDARPAIMLPQLKTNYPQLRKAVHYQQYGCYSYGWGVGYVGGLSGGPEGSVVTCVAETLASFIVHQNDITSAAYIDTSPSQTNRVTMWGANLANAAISRHTPILGSLGPSWTYAGCCTEMAFKEWAAACIGRTASGVAFVGGGTGRQSAYTDYFTGTEARFIGEICHAARGMKREDANELVKDILKMYEDQIKNPPIGKTFQECYDMKTLKPSQEYMELFKKAKNELQDMGLKFEY